jgi:hypothetical protein
MSLFIIVILINRLVSFIIRALKENPLPTGMLDIFFQKIQSCVSLLQREVGMFWMDTHTSFIKCDEMTDDVCPRTDCFAPSTRES